MYHFFYKLDENKNAIPCSYQDYSSYITIENRIVKQEKFDHYLVSTVFLGINHAPSVGTPELFETMILDENKGEWLEYQERYPTWKEAEEGHQNAIQWLKQKSNYE